MVEWIAKYWLEVLFSGLLTGLGFIVKLMWQRQKREDLRQQAIELGIQALLRDRVVQAYYHYIERGWIMLHGLEAAEKMYTEYHNLGGNGTVTKLMEDLRELPVRDKTKEKKEKEKGKGKGNPSPDNTLGRDSFFADFYYNIPKKIGGI